MKSCSVLVLTPFGRGGKGGIDRLMDAVQDQLATSPSQGVRTTFKASRGPGRWPISLRFLITLVQTAQMLLFKNVDVIHLNLSIRGSTYRKLVFAALANAFGKPYILHLNGSNYDEFWDAARPSVRRRIDALFQGAASIIVTGTYWRAAVLSRVPAVQGRILVMPNATPAPQSLPPSQDQTVPTILFLGRLGDRKGVPDLIDALQLIRTDRWRAILAGDGEEERFRSLVQSMGLTDRVEIPGWVGEAGVKQLLAHSDILALPSREENLPMAIVEALGYGLALVCTPVGAVPDIIEHEKNGLLVPLRDPEAIAAALRRLLRDPELRRRLGESARSTHADRLDIRPFTAHLVALWRRLADPHAAVPLGGVK
jgi:glycosyltransferase involved in cell wall biosynthesis